MTTYRDTDNARDLAMLARLALLDALAADAEPATLHRLARVVRDTGDHLAAQLDRRRNPQAIATVDRWRRMAAALDAGAVVDDLAASVDRRRRRNEGRAR